MVSSLTVPEQVDGYPVTGIAKKAFLSRQTLENLYEKWETLAE